jgi:NADPH:quinone reductase-like Zn-dependent oxidoreductase
MPRPQDDIIWRSGRPATTSARVCGVPLSAVFHYPENEDGTSMTMKAWVYERYGSPDVLGLEEVEAPAPAGEEVAVRVHACGLNAADWHVMRADPFLVRLRFGLRRPRRAMIAGCDIAGVVESVGDRITRFSPGDHVYAEVGFTGGLGELATVREDRLARMPANCSFEQAAAVPVAGVTALRAIRDAGRVRPGTTVLLIGASGGVGTFALQIARALGGVVTAVCSPPAAALVRSLGADEVVDYTAEKVVDAGRSYDVIVNNGGTHSLRSLRRTLTPRGTLAAVGGSQHGGLFGPAAIAMQCKLVAPFVSQRLVAVEGNGNEADLTTLAAMIEAGDVTPVIDRVYPLEEAPDALRYVEAGHPKGKVVVTVSDARSEADEPRRAV